VEHTWAAGYQGGSMITIPHTTTCCLDPDELHAKVIDEGVKDADGIAASAHAGNYVVG
jgi:hypothetical protein